MIICRLPLPTKVFLQLERHTELLLHLSGVTLSENAPGGIKCSYFDTIISPILKNRKWLKKLSDPNLDILCVQQSDATPFCENYAKLYFDVKHLENGMNEGW